MSKAARTDMTLVEDFSLQEWWQFEDWVKKCGIDLTMVDYLTVVFAIVYELPTDSTELVIRFKDEDVRNSEKVKGQNYHYCGKNNTSYYYKHRNEDTID